MSGDYLPSAPGMIHRRKGRFFAQKATGQERVCELHRKSKKKGVTHAQYSRKDGGEWRADVNMDTDANGRREVEKNSWVTREWERQVGAQSIKMEE